MAIVQSLGSLQRVAGREAPPPPSYGVPSYQSSVFDTASFATYAAIYRTQPSVRTVVEFLARNIAHLGLHVFRRVSDTDRIRLANHELAQWIAAPNPATVRYRLIESLVQDLGIYFFAVWLKVRGETRISLVRLPPETVYPDGWLLPRVYYWGQPNGEVVTLQPSEVVAFNGYNPCDPIRSLSPIETLRGILAEEAASRDYRRSYWQNAARLEGVIQRPLTAPRWTPDQKQLFREQWQARFAGAHNAGQTPVLEDGMTFQATSFSAKDSEFTEARKLSREEVAAAYHVPQPMVGILDHATFSNIKEQHKNLYQDTVGPWLAWIQEEVERQLLIECDDQQDVYTEFNIHEKLKGSFEEQAAALQTMVGRPVMTPNEGRARLNLPSIKNDPTADQLALPLNTAATGYARPPTEAVARIEQTWRRQADRLARLAPAERAAAFDVGRWDRELAQDLEAAYRDAGHPPEFAARHGAALAQTINAETLQLLVKGEDAFSPAREAALYVDD